MRVMQALSFMEINKVLTNAVKYTFSFKLITDKFTFNVLHPVHTYWAVSGPPQIFFGDPVHS